MAGGIGHLLPLLRLGLEGDEAALQVGGVGDVIGLLLLHRPEALSAVLERKLLGWPKKCKLAHAFPWECSYKGFFLPMTVVGQCTMNGPMTSTPLYIRMIGRVNSER